RGVVLALITLCFPEARAQTAQRIYELNGSYAETNGGSALVPNGGTLGATGYTFAAGQGPSASNALANPGEYTIEVLFRISDLSSYRSLINFNNLTSDFALYNQNGSFLFYNYSAGNSTTTDFVAGQTHRLVVTRNATTKVATAYVDGVQKAQVTDLSDLYVASGSGGILHFFRDNAGENTAGFVDQIRIYHSVLTPAQVAALGQSSGPAPEIQLKGNATVIVDGDATPSATDHTQFGTVVTSLARTFTIENTGNASLSISSIAVSGTHASEFVVSGAPASVAAGSSATFAVTFTPLPGTGTRVATITVNNNDSDEAAYDFAVEASVTPPTVTSVLPSEGTTAGGTGLTIFGAGFGGDTTVTIGGVPATGVNVYSSTLLTCIAPAGTVGAKSVVVTNPRGANSANTLYTYAATTPGDLQALNAGLNGVVFTSVTQPDGKIVIAGVFSQVLGVPRAYIARLHADGALDGTFNPDVNNQVLGLLRQPDGKLVICGNFTSVGGVKRNYIARLDESGALDAFDPGINNSSIVTALCQQPDGKLLIGGSFNVVQGVARSNIARLHPDGTLDTTFSPSTSGSVSSIALDADGNILLSGEFTSVQSTGSASSSDYRRLVRLSPTGVLDTSFRPQPDRFTSTLLVLPDGKIVVGGQFTSVQPNGAASPTARAYLARFNADGTLDTGFSPTVPGEIFTLALQADGKLLGGGVNPRSFRRWLPNGTADTGFFGTTEYPAVWGATLQPDGRVLVGGSPFTINSTTRSNFARLNNDLAINTLSAPNRTQVLWARGGSAPEISQVTFERSLDGGVTWTSLGTPVRVAGTANWQITGLNLPDGVQLRARGRSSGGYHSASSGVIEQVASFSNAPPTDITPSATALAENNAANAIVGTLSTTDANAGDLFTYALVPGAGATDNASFTIVGDALRLTPVADFETKSAYSVRIRSTDTGGRFFEKALVIAITNVNEAPGFTKGADIVVPHGTTTPQTVEGWATAINDGDATVVQALTFTVTVTSGANLFATAPALSATGALSFRPAGTAGVATVQVTLTDDATAGTAALTTAAQTFTITVQAPPLVPFLASISPASGTSAGGATVTITGDNFGAVSSVSFGGVPAASFVVNSATSITAVTPAGTPGAADVTVATAGGTSATSPLFTYFAPTTTTLTASQNPSVFVTPPIFTARAVSAHSGLAGQMELFIDNVLFEAKAVDASGVATFAPPATALLSGTRGIRAVYNSTGAVASFGTSSATLDQVVQRANLPITLTGLAQTYDGSPKPVGATVSILAGFTGTVSLTYAGSATAPTDAGSYPVVATLDHPQFFGSASGTLVVAPAQVSIGFFDTLQSFDGSPRVAGFTTFPPGIPAVLSYQSLVNGVPGGPVSTTPPVAAGRYRLTAAGTNPNYVFTSATGELQVSRRGVAITLGRLFVTADGQPKPVTVTTVPDGIALNITYTGGGTTTTTAPSFAPPGGGVWRVNASVVDTVSYAGSARADLRIDGLAPAPITLTGPSTANPVDFAIFSVSVRPIRYGVALGGTVIFKRDGVEFHRATPNADGNAYALVPKLPIRANPYLITAEYTGDANYAANTAAPLALTMTKKIIQLPEREETKTYDGRPFMVSYRGRVFEGYTVNESLVTYNGSRAGPIDAAATRQVVEIIAPLSSPDIELRETVRLLVNKRATSIRLANMAQTLRPSGNHKPDVIVEPSGAPFLVSFNGNTLTPAQARIDSPGVYDVRAWISNPNYEPAEAAGTFVLTREPAMIEIGNLTHVYDGKAKSATVKIIPAISYDVTYNGSNQQPDAPGLYTVRVTPIPSGYGPGATATLSIASRIGVASRDGDDSAGLGSFELRNANGDIVATNFPANIVPDANFADGEYSYGELTYIPVEGSGRRTRFSHWEGVGGYSGKQNPLRVYFSAPKPPGGYLFTARYDIETLIVPSAQGNGTVAGAEWFRVGDLARFTARPAAGHIVDRWLYNGQVVGTSNEVLIKIAKNGGFPIAVFTPGYFAIARSHPWYDKVFGTASFIRKSQPDLPALSAGFVPLSSEFVATAVPSPGFVFDYWELINAQPATPFDLRTSSTATFRPIDTTKQVIAHAHFLERAPTMDVSIESLTRVPNKLPSSGSVRFNLRVNNSRAPATNVRVPLVEVTGYRVMLTPEDKFWKYYYPNPRNQSEINANDASVLTAEQRTALSRLGPKYWDTIDSSRSSNLGNIGAKTVEIYKGFEMNWTKYAFIGAANREQVRITVHIVADGYAQSFDSWQPLYIADAEDFAHGGELRQ
nr:MBG domain-containing protein [Opitutaceae bacterium]